MEEQSSLLYLIRDDPRPENGDQRNPRQASHLVLNRAGLCLLRCRIALLGFRRGLLLLALYLFRWSKNRMKGVPFHPRTELNHSAVADFL